MPSTFAIFSHVEVRPTVYRYDHPQTAHYHPRSNAQYCQKYIYITAFLQFLLREMFVNCHDITTFVLYRRKIAIFKPLEEKV